MQLVVKRMRASCGSIRGAMCKSSYARVGCTHALSPAKGSQYVSAGHSTSRNFLQPVGAPTRNSGTVSTAVETAAKKRRARRPFPLAKVSSSSSMTQQQQQGGFAAVAPTDLVSQLLQLTYPPVPPLIGREPGSFAQETITTRLPAILDTVLADLEVEGLATPDSSLTEQQQQDRQQQLQAVAGTVQQIQQDMPADNLLLPLQVPDNLPATHPLQGIIPATNAAVAAWQQHMTEQQQQQQGAGSSSSSEASAAAAVPCSWLQLPWLLVECCLYVRLASTIAQQPLLLAAGYDPFFRQKSAALTKSMAAAADIAAALQNMLKQQQQHADRQQLVSYLFGDDNKQRLYQLFQYALWGNKTDLSMLVDVVHMDTPQMAAIASSSTGSSKTAGIVIDDFNTLWSYLEAKAYSDSAAAADAAVPQVDIVLDNAGLELFTDLCLADYVVSSGFSKHVVLHGKALPWFVSDTLHHDLQHLLTACSSSDVLGAVQECAKRWQQHLQTGRWRFTADSFWTTPYPFWWMAQLAPELHADLATSSLVIWKGDLNYRKLAGDCRWPPTTPFTTALQGFCPTGMISLRTLKADVIAGLPEGEAEQLDKLDPKWQVNGKFGVVQFVAPGQL